MGDLAGESWPFPVALAWQQASASLATDHDPHSHYEYLESVWVLVLRLMALHGIGSTTPHVDGAPVPPIDLLRQPSHGHWVLLLQEILPKRPDGTHETLRELAARFHEAKPRPAARALVTEGRAILEAAPHPTGAALSLRALFDQLVWLRNRKRKTLAPWPRHSSKRIVDLLHACACELLEDDNLRDVLRLGVEDADGNTIRLDGPQCLYERAAAATWRSAAVFGGAMARTDLQGLVVAAACPRCEDFSILMLDELGELVEAQVARPSYVCVRCAARLRNNTAALLLRRRLDESAWGVPWVDVANTHHRPATGQTTRLSFQVSNPLLRTLRRVRIELELPDAVDVCGEASPILPDLAPRRRSRVDVHVQARAAGLWTLRPLVRWEDDNGARDLSVSPIVLDVRRERRAERLVGRERELAELFAALERAKVSGDGLAVIEGPPGVGRTALVDHFAERLPPEVVVLRTRCERDHLRPTQALGELVLKYARYYADIREWQVDGRASDVLLYGGDLLDVIHRVSEHVGFVDTARRIEGSGAVQSEEDHDRAKAEALRGFIDLIAKNRPAVVLCLDRVDRAPPRTLHLLRSLASGLLRRPVLILVTTTASPARRDDSEQSEALRGLLDLASWRWTLAPLTRDQVDEYLELVYPRNTFTAAFRDRVWETSRGQPFILTQSLSTLEDRGVLAQGLDGWACATDPNEIELPEQIARTLEQRLQSLAPRYLEVVKRASVLGERFRYDLLTGALFTDLSLHDKLQLATILDDLDRTYHVLRELGDEHEFTHRRLWNAAYHQLSERQREALHEMVITHLEERVPASLERDTRIAEHAVLGKQVSKAVDYAVGVGTQLLDDRRNEEAYSVLYRAFALQRQRGGVAAVALQALSVAAGRASRRVGRLREAIGFEEANAEAAASRGDGVGLSQALLSQAVCYQALGELTAASEVLRRGADVAASLDDRSRLAATLAAWSAVLHGLGRDDASEEVATRCLLLCDQVEGTERSRADCTLTIARRRAALGDINAAVAHAREARDLYTTANALADVAKAEYALSYFHAEAGDLRQALGAVKRALEHGLRSNDVHEVARARLRLGELLTRAGAIQEAREQLSLSRRFWARVDQPVAAGDCQLAEAWLALEIDDSQRAERLAAAALQAYAKLGDASRIARATATLMRALIRHGSEHQVERLLADAGDNRVERADAASRLELALTRSAALRFLGRRDEALSVLAQANTLVGERKSALAQGRWRLERACCLRDKDALAAYDEAALAASAFEGSGDAMLACQARTLMAQCLVDQGEGERAATILDPLLVECQALNDSLGVAMCLQELGRIAARRGERERAEAYYARSRHERSALEDFRGLVILDDLSRA